MNCEKTQELLWALSEGTLDRAAAESAEEHIRSCEACRGELEEVRRTLAALRMVPTIEPRTDFEDRLRLRIDAWEARRGATWLAVVGGFLARNRRLVAASTTAFVLALCGGLYILHGGLGLGPGSSEQIAARPAATAEPTSYEGIVPASGTSQNFVMREIPYQSQQVTIVRKEGADTVYTRFPTREIAPPRGLVRDNYIEGPAVTPVSTAEPIY